MLNKNVLNEEVNKKIAKVLVNYTKDCSQLSFIFSKNSMEDLDKMKNLPETNVFLEDIKIYILKV